MSLEKRLFDTIRPFGPYLIKSTISDEIHKILLDTAYKIRKNKKLKKNNDYRKRLAGNLSEEYSYANALSENQFNIVKEELTWLASVFTKQSKIVTGKKLEREPKDIIMLEPLWVNFMKQGEWNPAHAHTGEISCVMYLKVPKEIENENLKSQTSSQSNTPSAGKIEWLYGETITYDNTGFIATPKEKDIYFFPARLKHMVYPFKSKTERISLSVNFGDKVNSLSSLNKQGEMKQ